MSIKGTLTWISQWRRSMNKDHTSHPITGDVGQDHERLVYQGRDIGMMLLTGDTGTMAIQTDQT